MQSQDQVIFDAFFDQVQRFPKKVALIVEGELIDYTTLLQRVRELETILLQSEVKKSPIAVISELLNDDGSTMCGDDLKLFSKKHNLKKTSVEEIYHYLYK